MDKETIVQAFHSLVNTEDNSVGILCNEIMSSQSIVLSKMSIFTRCVKSNSEKVDVIRDNICFLGERSTGDLLSLDTDFTYITINDPMMTNNDTDPQVSVLSKQIYFRLEKQY